MTKAFLLGAGLGTRLRPLTTALPKPLIPVFHRPLITHALDHCLAAGISEFAINTHHLPEKWAETFPGPSGPHRPAPHPGDPSAPTGGTYRGTPLTFFHEPRLLETGGGIKNIAEWIGSDPILVYNGDILTGIPVDRLIAAHLASDKTVTLGLRSHGPNRHIALDGDRVIDIRRLLDTAPGTHQFTGIYCINPGLLCHLPPGEKASVIPAFLELIRDRALGGAVLDDGPWLDLGTRDSYLAAHLDPAPAGIDRPPLVHPGARIDPAATIENSAVGPGCVVGPGAVLRHSVVWPGREIRAAARLTNCIVYSSTPATGTHHDTDL